MTALSEREVSLAPQSHPAAQHWAEVPKSEGLKPGEPWCRDLRYVMLMVLGYPQGTGAICFTATLADCYIPPSAYVGNPSSPTSLLPHLSLILQTLRSGTCQALKNVSQRSRSMSIHSPSLCLCGRVSREIRKEQETQAVWYSDTWPEV